MVDKPALLNCKALSVLKTVNTKNEMLMFCIALTFALISMTFDRYLLDR